MSKRTLVLFLVILIFLVLLVVGFLYFQSKNTQKLNQNINVEITDPATKELMQYKSSDNMRNPEEILKDLNSIPNPSIKSIDNDKVLQELGSVKKQ
ncbi:hypothetical protein K8Q94_02115 [Candidatus Nomurabacteria bacterium]|nr:hypothetical protein [Candidatus Nomurabacteria bacterium]